MAKDSSVSPAFYIYISVLIIIIGSIILFFKDNFGLAGEIAFEVGLKFFCFSIIIAIISFVFSSFFTIFFTIAIPCSIFWYRPILDFKAMQVFKITGEMPFYGTIYGQLAIVFVLTLLSFGIWINNRYK
ncbi:hypothetical protein ACT4YP_20160 (plasmid) [Acinetobacter baumannii]